MPALVVPFTKMHGAGNDFIVLDNRFLHLTHDELADIARRFSPRRFGVGSDGVLALSVPADIVAVFRDNLERYREGRGLLYTVDADRGY